MNGFLILFLVVWYVIGISLTSSAFSTASDNGANWKQLTYIGFFLGPLVWALSVLFGILGVFAWIYEFLGKDNKKTKK
jgi:uncharacterized BrkB/YihY/UPF0761 family membrane protein